MSKEQQMTIEEILGEHADDFMQWVTKYPDSEEAKDAEGSSPRGELPYFAKYLQRFLVRDAVSLRLKEIGADPNTIAKTAMSMANQMSLHGFGERRRKLLEMLPPHSNN
jgi:hypothetical protein